MVAMERPKLSRNLKGTGRELTIVSGTGAYLGVQGTISQSTDQTTAIQVESRDFSQLTFSASLMPATLPVIASVAGGPAITHADFSLVTASQPAAPGEVLTAYATDLMPELESPPVNGGSSVSSMTGLPISVSVGERNARVLYAGPYPGTTNGYQINFQIPENTPSGITMMRALSGFIPSPSVQLSVR